MQKLRPSFDDATYYSTHKVLLGVCELLDHLGCLLEILRKLLAFSVEGVSVAHTLVEFVVRFRFLHDVQCDQLQSFATRRHH